MKTEKALLVCPDGGRWVALRDAPLNEYVRFKVGGPVWVRGRFSPSEKKYWLTKFDGMCQGLACKGDVMVLVGFTF